MIRLLNQVILQSKTTYNSPIRNRNKEGLAYIGGNCSRKSQKSTEIVQKFVKVKQSVIFNMFLAFRKIKIPESAVIKIFRLFRVRSHLILIYEKYFMRKYTASSQSIGFHVVNTKRYGF